MQSLFDPIRVGVDSNPGPLFEAAARAMSDIGVAYIHNREPGPGRDRHRRTGAAIANVVFHTTRVRVRSLPITVDELIEGSALLVAE